MTDRAPSRLFSWAFSPLSRFVPDWVGAMFLGLPIAKRVSFYDGDRSSGAAVPDHLSTEFLNEKQRESPFKPGQIIDAILPENAFLKRQVSAPGSAARSLMDVARLDLQRRTPLRMENIHWMLGARQKTGAQIVVDQWIVKNTDLAKWSAQLNGVGIRVRQYLVAGAEEYGPIADLSKDLSPHARRWRWLNGSLALIAICFALIWWLYPAWALGPQLRALDTQTSLLRAEALELRPQIERLRDYDTEKAAFLDGINRRAVLSEALRELTVALPDTVWLETLSFSADGLVFGGETQHSAPELVLELSKNGRFRNPRLTGPVSKTATGAERFELTLDLGGAP